MNRWSSFRTMGTASLLLLMAALCACQYQPGQDIEDAIRADSSKSAASSISGEQPVTIETKERSVEIMNATEKWPDELPADVPRLTNGKIRKIIRTETPEGKSWDMAIDGLPEHALKDYEAALKVNGFQTSSMIVAEQTGDRGSLTGEKGPVTVVMIGSGSGASLSVIQKQ
jgi:hypothetical protein